MCGMKICLEFVEDKRHYLNACVHFVEIHHAARNYLERFEEVVGGLFHKCKRRICTSTQADVKLNVNY